MKTYKAGFKEYIFSGIMEKTILQILPLFITLSFKSKQKQEKLSYSIPKPLYSESPFNVHSFLPLSTN